MLKKKDFCLGLIMLYLIKKTFEKKSVRQKIKS